MIRLGRLLNPEKFEASHISSRPCVRRFHWSSVEEVQLHRPFGILESNTCRLCRFLLFIVVLGSTSELGRTEEAPTASTVQSVIATPLTPGDHSRYLYSGAEKRSYILHVPPGYDPKKPTPVVLALHGAAMNGSMMVWFTNLNKTADAKGFIAVYPSGTGPGPLRTWNAGGLISRLKGKKTDDVAFIGHLLDELESIANVDRNRIYACGMSNGGMMSYRLASEMSDRIAAIAAVSGTMAMDLPEPPRAVPVLHFHGTSDGIVPYGSPINLTPPVFQLLGAEDTVAYWAKRNGCEEECQVDMLSREGDKRTVTRRTYPQKATAADVVLVVIDGGGHTWPGRQVPIAFLGRCARNISANELIWEFFEKHPLKQNVPR